jgi:lysophospholipase L1-like esterase
MATGPELRETLRSTRLNNADYERMERGYYEQILDSGRTLGDAGGVAKSVSSQTEPPPFEAGPLALEVADLREFVLKPNLSIIQRLGTTWTTNALGMRDKTYATKKPLGVYRIAFAGDSIGAGWGVNDGDGFEPTLERQLDTQSRQAGGPVIEVLNFAVPGHGPGQRWEHFSKVGWPMDPDLVLFEATQADVGWDERRLRGLLARGLGWDSAFYRDVLAKSGARPGKNIDSYKRLLKGYRWELTAGVYRAVTAECRARGVPCIWVLIPRVGKAVDPDEHRRLVALAREADFAAIVDLSDAYDGIDSKSVAISATDYHPNAAGHALLARRLEDALKKSRGFQRRMMTDQGGAPQ